VLEAAMVDAGAESVADVPGFVQRFQPGFPVGTIDRIQAGSVMELSPMVRTFVPFMLFIDRKGVIQSQYTGSDDFLKDEAGQDQKIRAEVQKLLAQAVAKPSSTGRKHTK